MFADNVKALFRRGRAHVGAWNPEQARTDFTRAAELDTTLKAAVVKELKLIENKVKEKESMDRAKLEGKLFS